MEEPSSSLLLPCCLAVLLLTLSSRIATAQEGMPTCAPPANGEYEGGSSPNAFKRFDELTTCLEAAVTNYQLNTSQVGFAGHSYGAGFLPAIVQREMMGKGSF